MNATVEQKGKSMKIIIRIVAILAAIMGLMAVVTGARVLLGVFDPGYQFFISLIVYNIIIGVVSIITSIYIWRNNKTRLLLSKVITGLHLTVLLLLITIFSEIISNHSIGAMAVRSVAWIIFSVIIWRSNSN